MSNTLVRRYARDMIAAFLPDAPFQDTNGIDLKSKSLPEVWSTVEYGNADEQRLTVGKNALYRETSSFDIVLMGRAGFGPDALIAMGERFRRAATDVQVRLTDESGFTGMLKIDSLSPPNPDDYEEGNWLTVAIVVVYTFDSVRGAVE